MQRTKIRTAIVGCGKVAHLHAAALKTLPASEFVAVCGSHPERRAAFAQKYGVKAYATIDELIAAGAAEMITVATPHPAHVDAATKAARAGLHVLVEKPLAASLADCDAILAAARAGGGSLGMICQRRFFEPCQRIRRAIDAGKLGRPMLGTVTMLGWRDAAYYRSDPWRGSWQGEGGGVLVNQAPHQLDLLLWFEHYHRLQIDDFLQSILERRPPLVTGEQGRQTVELFTGIYRATRDRCAIRFPLLPEVGRDDFDGRRLRQPM